ILQNQKDSPNRSPLQVSHGNPLNSSPAEGYPNEGSPNEGSPNEGSPNEGSPNEGSPNEGFPNEDSSNEGSPNEGPSNVGPPNESSPPLGPCYYCKGKHLLMRCPKIPDSLRNHCIKCWMPDHNAKECPQQYASPQPEI
ncbi:14223_t:CDS:1, partial [Dentiscutata heterogama]